MSDNIVNSNRIIVVKRDGKKVDFNKAKIAVAIKKGFDSVKLENGENKSTFFPSLFTTIILFELTILSDM